MDQEKYEPQKAIAIAQKGSSLLAALATLMGVASAPVPGALGLPTIRPGSYGYKAPRSRAAGQKNPAGSKLAMKATYGKLGIAVLK